MKFKEFEFGYFPGYFRFGDESLLENDIVSDFVSSEQFSVLASKELVMMGDLNTELLVVIVRPVANLSHKIEIEIRDDEIESVDTTHHSPEDLISVLENKVGAMILTNHIKEIFKHV